MSSPKQDEAPQREQPINTSFDDDDVFSAASSYQYDSSTDLSVLQAAILLVADCLGTGILALPADMVVLGHTVGLGFLLLNLPINLYAGAILSRSALVVEARQLAEDVDYQNAGVVTISREDVEDDQCKLPALDQGEGDEAELTEENPGPASTKHVQRNTYASIQTSNLEANANDKFEDEPIHQHAHLHHDTATFDFIGMTQALFHNRYVSYFVLFIYYANLFLILGNYILVMSHAVAALVGGKICIPVAGLIASTLMFGVSQLSTMAKLGRSASIISLLCLLVVVIQCLVALERNGAPPPTQFTALRKSSATASIGFAMGSQKLLLNIRREMKERQRSPQSLAIGLVSYTFVYIGICLAAGPNPPSFLFDAITEGMGRQLGGLLLWIHVAVSYAINSQALCSSMDRLYVHKLLPTKPALRWLLLTLGMSVSSYLVANAIPFFTDLVSFIGAMTSIPLTLLLPAILYRRAFDFPVLWPDCSFSFALLLFSTIFMGVGLVGSIGEIDLDWESNRPPFSCD